jgi:hypothetical protein
MTIINHGSWSRYVPTVFPLGVPTGAIFCKRDADGIDWYDYVHNGASFAPASIKLTVFQGVAMAVTNDAQALFPAGCVLVEITGDNTVDPQAAYGGFIYDAAANTLTAPAPLSTVPQFAPRQARLALLNAGLLDTVNSLITTAGGANLITWEYATEINRSDPLIASIGSTLNLSPEQIDALFTQAAGL